MQKKLPYNTIVMGAAVRSIAPAPSADAVQLTVQMKGGSTQSQVYQHVINTVPPAVLRTIDTSTCDFSYRKRTALRTLHVDSSVKVGLLFSTRWWQQPKYMKAYPIKGGQSSTDLPIRTIVYPSQDLDDEKAAGVLIASYTWAQDAQRMGSIQDDLDRVKSVVLSNLAEVHQVDEAVLTNLLVDVFVQDWYRDEFSQGAFALFGPGQFLTNYGGLCAPEMGGRYHTAGEASSVHHAWIVGAFNSAWRCVLEVLEKEHWEEAITQLKADWGTVDEVDEETLSQYCRA